MSETYSMGIDIGSTTVKVAVLNTKGRLYFQQSAMILEQVK